ncbi:MAG: xanthine dehydrogenase family protein molybdopterin-binding subunit, partial [Actinobacteria bacterium]|nr:xanthine dehydrogenase family protein molybdopterin-binding subunit [Actinomycetota bacterium]NIW31927.1 xanthine dehydrogenase family protein molybdopterin-binding subunit [Actinomycetota bacterium]NIX24190.1 xanthine dehydrogenase family protein molybdopterin-binding subunit [Actinomycetota bacterium]
VVAAFTGADVAASDSPGVVDLPNPLPNGVAAPPPLLVEDRVRHVGDAVAAVVAEDRYTAHEALDRIEVEYERRDAVVEADDALA